MPVKNIKSVLITGAAQRIGRAIALALSADGWSVGVHYNSSEQPSNDLVQEIKQQGGKAEALQADLLNEKDLARLITTAESTLGGLGCLINNAAVFEKDSLLDSNQETWNRHFQINLRAPFVLIQNFAQELPDSMMGNVINIIDQRVWNLTPGFASYTLSKSALWTLTQTAAATLAPRIRVNAIGPGPTLPSVHQSQQQFDQQCESVPLKHGAKPEEIAAAVQFILDAPSITGQMIAVDGGQHLGVTSGMPKHDLDG
ncbi:MAG: SDR family oxidoreductase [Rhodospirillales bacterium]|jgi:NAD(P)-dependent dehydrogenase (short-subunit alcohol dehydrogenase family)